MTGGGKGQSGAKGQSATLSESGLTERERQNEAIKEAESELSIEEDIYRDMDFVHGGSDDGGFIIIVSVVLLGLVCTSLLTLHMINQNKARRIIEANMRDRKMMELSEKSPLDMPEDYTNVKGKGNFSFKQKVSDNLKDSVEQELNFRNPIPLDGAGVIVEEYGDQYNANHDFAIF